MEHEGRSGEAPKKICYTRIIGRKRIHPKTPEQPFKRICCSPSDDDTIEKPRCIESSSDKLDHLPEDLLISIISKASHGDLKHLLLVSKTLREAALISKETHFDFKTPVLRPEPGGGEGWPGEDLGDDDGPQAPMAPIRVSRSRSRVGHKDLADISVTLFTDSDE